MTPSQVYFKVNEKHYLSHVAKFDSQQTRPLPYCLALCIQYFSAWDRVEINVLQTSSLELPSSTDPDLGQGLLVSFGQSSRRHRQRHVTGNRRLFIFRSDRRTAASLQLGHKSCKVIGCEPSQKLTPA